MEDKEEEGQTGFWLIPFGFAMLIGMKALGHGVAGHAVAEFAKFFGATFLLMVAVFHMRSRMEKYGVTVASADEEKFGAQAKAIAAICFVLQLLAPGLTKVIVWVALVWIVLNWIFIRD